MFRHRRIYQYNEIDFKLPNSRILKPVNKEKLSINSFYLFTSKLVIRKMLVYRDQNIINKKSFSLY